MDKINKVVNALRDMSHASFTQSHGSSLIHVTGIPVISTDSDASRLFSPFPLPSTCLSGSPVTMTEEIDESVYKTVFDPMTLVKKGLCPVTHVRGQDNDPLESHSLYYEIHGRGPEKIVFIIGCVEFLVMRIVLLIVWRVVA